MEESTDTVVMGEIRMSLPTLDSDEALQLLPPHILEELYRSVTSSVRLIRTVYGIKEIERLASDCEC